MLTLLVAALALFAISGTPALLDRGRSGEIGSTIAVLAGSACGLAASVATLATSSVVRARAAWQIPGGALALRLDPLAAGFLLPILVLGAAASVYGLGYWPAREQASAGRVRFFTGLLLAGMSAVVVAADSILFLVAWETMAIAAFFLVAADHADGEVRGAAWIYLVATHVGTLALFALFTLMRSLRGSFLLGPIPASAGALAASAVLLLALTGFGFKAGIFPLHFWLPGAHANAPSHVSALLSGAMLKVGVYGIVRILLLLPHPRLWWGGMLVLAGLASAIFAISLALGQTDMKRALAYSSIENIGLIVVALGLWTIGRAASLPALAALALAAAVAHVWAHSLFKGLLFFAAGSVLHATGTRKMSLLGGLLQRMPKTGLLFLTGAAAASALPGANAFVSEWLLYSGLLSEAPRGGIATLAAAVVALIGALALACFVRLTGSIFLGAARSERATHAHEAPLTMLVPAAVLAAACVATGLFPTAIAGALESITAARGTLVPLLHPLTLPLQLAAVGSALVLAAVASRARTSPRRTTWDCGYAAPTARMQYSAGSLSEWLTARLLPRFLSPAFRTARVDGLHPSAASHHLTVVEPVGDGILQPLVLRWADRAMRLRWVQQGRLPIYLLYIVVALILAMIWAVAWPRLGGVL